MTFIRIILKVVGNSIHLFTFTANVYAMMYTKHKHIYSISRSYILCYICGYYHAVGAVQTLYAFALCTHCKLYPNDKVTCLVI